jgi:hypothetical protein
MFGLNNLAWVGLLVWVGNPLLVILAAPPLWRRSQLLFQKGLVVAASVVILAAPLLISNGMKWWYDRQVRELCTKDGGVKVYETVRLPADRLNQWGQPNFQIPITPNNKLKESDDYYLVWEITKLKSGYINLTRNHFNLIRHKDQKLLAESVSYSRGGGDLPGPWANSSFSCPDKHKEIPLFQQTFIKSNSRSGK